MLLLIDIGNTNIVVGCYENEKITQEARLATDALKTSDQYCMDLKNLLSLYEIERASVTGVIISSVVPPVLNSVRTAVMKLTGKKPLVVGPGIKTGLNILLDNPASVGSDLVVGAVAALHEYEPPLIMIDMGTATTIAVVDKNGAYIGGSICTGVKVATEALAGRAAQLPGISLDMPKKAIGRNTIDAMRSGIMLGNACMIDGMIERIEEELGQKATVVATGGIARFILPMCRRKIIYDRNLLLKGLVILYENNRRDNPMSGEVFLPARTLRQAAKRIGMPFYVYDEAGLRQNTAVARAAFSWNAGFALWFPLRWNPNPAVLSILRESGCGVECTSAAELAHAERCGFSGEQIRYAPQLPDEAGERLAAQLGAELVLDDPALRPGFLPERVAPARLAWRAAALARKDGRAVRKKQIRHDEARVVLSRGLLCFSGRGSRPRTLARGKHL